MFRPCRKFIVCFTGWHSRVPLRWINSAVHLNGREIVDKLSVDINLYASGPREWSRRDHGPATLALSNYSRVCTDPSRFARLVVTSSHEQFRGILLPREEEKKRERERNERNFRSVIFSVICLRNAWEWLEW